MTREVEWDDDERKWMLAFQLYRAQLGPCGHYLPRAADPSAEGRYVVPPPTRCHACTAIGQAAEPYQTSPVPTALLFQVEQAPSGGRG